MADQSGVVAVEKKTRRFWRRKERQSPSPLTHCENCGAELNGHYCPQCGQAAIDYRRSLTHVIGEILDSFDITSKIFGTAWLLITRPWALTNEYLSGKRVRHLNPFKLYLFASIGFFFLVHYWTKDLPSHLGEIPPEEREKVAAEIRKSRPEIEKDLNTKDLSAETRRKVEQTLDQFSNPSVTPTASPSTSASANEQAASPSPSAGNNQGDFGVIKFDDNDATGPFGKWLQAKAKEKLGEHGSKLELFSATLLQIFPYMILCCIPVFALILKLLYIRRHVHYIDHLIYALHIHTFAFVGITVIIFATQGFDLFAPNFTPWVTVLWLIFAAQIFLSIRRVYRQGWFFSLLKFFVGGVVYFSVLLTALIATIVIYFSL
jgi:hypothetical protein